MLSHWEPNSAPRSFSTLLVPMTRGIMATMYCNVTKEVNIDELFALYHESYKDNYFVRVKEQGYFPSTKEVSGSNFCDISLAYDERTKRITVVSVIVNLQKD